MNQEKKNTQEFETMDPEMNQEKNSTQESEKMNPQMNQGMNQGKMNDSESKKMDSEFRNPEGQLLYCTERSGSKLQIKDSSGKVQFAIEPSGTQGSTLNVIDAKGVTLGSCKVEPSRVTEKDASLNTEKEPSKSTEKEAYKRTAEKV